MGLVKKMDLIITFVLGWCAGAASMLAALMWLFWAMVKKGGEG